MATAAVPASPGSLAIKAEKPAIRVDPLSLRAARVLLVFMLMAAPLAFGAVQTWAWASLALIAAVLLALWAVSCLQRRTATVYWSALYIPAALFLLLGIGQLASHHTLDPFETREALVQFGTDLVLFFLAGQFWADASSETRKWFGLAVAVYAFLIALFAIVQFFSSQGLLYWAIHAQGDVFGPYVNHNDYAGLMEMLIPISFCYAFSRPIGSPERNLLLFGVCGVVASVVLSGSRGGMISVVAEMALLGALLWRWRKDRVTHKRGALGLMGVAAAAALLLAITPLSSWQRLESITGLAHKPDVTLGDRLVVSQDALAAFKGHPWLGTGLGTFRPVFPQYQTFSSDLVWHHAHDDYVEALMETGVAGGVFILLALVLFLWLVFSNLPDRLERTAGWIQLGAALGCCGLLVHSFADFNLHIPANAAWFAVSAGLSVMPGMRFELRLR